MHRGWLEGEEVMIALRGVNSKLTEAEEEYMYRVSNSWSKIPWAETLWCMIENQS